MVVSGTPYIVPYRVHRETVEILRVFHAARKWPEEFSRHSSFLTLDALVTLAETHEGIHTLLKAGRLMAGTMTRARPTAYQNVVQVQLPPRSRQSSSAPLAV